MATLATLPASDMAASDSAITISCDDCALGRGPACEDCLVTFIVERDEIAHGPVVIAADEYRAVRMLVGAGLVPRLRYSRKAG